MTAVVYGVALATPALAAYPEKPIAVIVPFPAGGASDDTARIIGQRMAESLGQPVLVENRPGATGAIGVFSLNNSTFDVLLMAGFGLLGYVFRKIGCEPAPTLLGFILGPMMEENLRRAMLTAKGDPTVFLTRPVSAVLLLVALALLITVLAPSIRRKREEAFQE